MAESGQIDAEPSKTPGFGMRIILSTIRKQFPSVPNISTDMLFKWMKEVKFTEDQGNKDTQTEKRNIVILDCRPEIEYNISHIDGAVRVDFESDATEIIEAAPQLQSADISDVVCYCSIGYRSCTVVKKLHKYRETIGENKSKITKDASLYNLEGCLFKWANEHKPLVDKDGKPTTYVHPYNVVFGKLLDSEHRKWN